MLPLFSPYIVLENKKPPAFAGGSHDKIQTQKHLMCTFDLLRPFA